MARPMQRSDIGFSCSEQAAFSPQVEKELDGQTLAGLINNAGIANHAVLMHQPIEEFRKVLDINLVGILAVTQVSHMVTCTHAWLCMCM